MPLCLDEEEALTLPRRACSRVDRSESYPEELLDDSEELDESDELESDSAERLRERERGEAERLRGDAER